jgi:hypothetical protein
MVPDMNNFARNFAERILLSCLVIYRDEPIRICVIYQKLLFSLTELFILFPIQIL